MRKALRVSLKRGPAIVANKIAADADRLVYVLLADKRIKYTHGRSYIVYIGTTKKGISRITYSVAKRASDILALHGVRGFEVRILTCTPRQRVKTWHKLERALILAFRDEFGEVPRCNTVGKRMRRTDERNYFRERRIKALIKELS